MTEQHERPSDKIAKRYSLPDRLKPENTQDGRASNPLADFKQRWRRKKDSESGD